jgi:Ribonuclease HIII
MNKQVSFKANTETLKQMSEFYKNKKRVNLNPSIYFVADEDEAVVTAYTNGRVRFQGKRADIFFESWFEINNHNSDINKNNVFGY